MPDITNHFFLPLTFQHCEECHEQRFCALAVWTAKGPGQMRRLCADCYEKTGRTCAAVEIEPRTPLKDDRHIGNIQQTEPRRFRDGGDIKGPEDVLLAFSRSLPF